MTTTRNTRRPPAQALQLEPEVPALQRSGFPLAKLNQLHGKVVREGSMLLRDKALKSWAATQAGATGDLARRIVLARIEWDRSLGRPHALGLAAAFTALHWRWQEVKMFTPRGVRWPSLSSPVLPPPVLTEGPHDDARWRVSILLLPTHDAKQALEVGFAKGADWKGPDGRRVRVGVRPALRYFSAGTGPVALPAFVLHAAD